MANTTPVVTVNDKVLFINAFTRITDLFTVFDADGDTISRYRFLDFSNSGTSGFVEINNSARPNGSLTTISASQLDDAFYIAGSNVSQEGLRIQAWDGTEWSSPVSVAQMYTVRQNVTRPEVNLLTASVLGNESIAASSFISATDPDGWPIQKFFIRDTRNDNAYFKLNGQVMAQNSFFTVQADQLENLRYHGDFQGTEQVKVFAYDGGTWSNVGSTNATTIFNANRPIGQFKRVVAQQRTLMDVGEHVNFSDADGNTAKAYRFLDTNPHSHSGELQVAGVAQPCQTGITVPANELNSVKYLGAERNYVEKIRFRVYDGRYWSGVETVEFDIVPKPSLGGPRNAVVQQLEEIELSEVVFQTDNGPQFLSYEIVDLDTAATSGQLFNDFNPLPSGVVNTIGRVEFEEDIRFSSGTFEARSLDEVYIRGWNGTFFSEWTRVNIRTEPEYLNAIHRPGIDPSWNTLLFEPPGTQTEIAYSFMQQFPNYETGEAVDEPGNDPPRPFIQFTPVQRTATRRMFALMESFANVKFTEVSDTGIDPISGDRGGTIRLGNYTLEDSTASAFAFFPGFAPQSGDIWINSVFNPIFSGQAWDMGGSSYTTLLHELGHAMGMNHPFVEPGGGNQKPTLPPATDNDGFTVMSYTGSQNGRSPWSYMLYDIANYQAVYGANNNFANGDDYYSIDNTWRGESDFFWSIWDTGGHDTIDAEGSLINTTIDLRAGSLSSMGTIRDNLSIAFGVTIEDALGANFDDTLIGNEVNNRLTGFRGNDTFWGGGGNDTMVGGIGNDQYFFGIGDGTDTIDEAGGTGRDRLSIRAFPGLDSLENDLSFRIEETNDLVIDLTLDQGDSEGQIRIDRQLWGSYRVETLEIGGLTIDLVNLASQAEPFAQRFRPIEQTSNFGSLVVPV